MRCPSGLMPPKYCRAIVSLMMATCAAGGSSPVANARPATIGVDVVSKKRGPTWHHRARHLRRCARQCAVNDAIGHRGSAAEQSEVGVERRGLHAWNRFERRPDL